jgi:hypothetical protein
LSPHKLTLKKNASENNSLLFVECICWIRF